MRSGQVINQDQLDPMRLVNVMLSADQIYPAGLSCIPQLPPMHQMQQQVAQGGNSKQQRRRRRKAKNKEGATGGLKKRKLSDEQASMLEMSFGREHKLESERKDRLAAELGLDPRQVAVWFQNRRARWKNKRLELEFSKLTSQHHSTLLQKCNLEAQVLKLQAELEEAHTQLNRLSTAAVAVDASCGCTTMSINSPTSSMTIDLDHPAAASSDSISIPFPADYPFNHPDFYFQGPSPLPDHHHWNVYNLL